MLLVVLLLVSKAGALCVGGPQELRTGEVLVMCPLSEDARLTKLDVVISHSNHDQSIPDTMLGCVWPERDSLNPDCRSRFHFTLASLQKDCVMAWVPRAQLHKDGFYQSQLVPPPDADHAFSRCLVYDNDDTEDPTTTLSPVIPAADHPRPRDPMEKVLTYDTEDPTTTLSPEIPAAGQPWARDPMEKVLTDDHPGDNSVLVAVLTSVGVILLVLIVLFVAFKILRHRRTVPPTPEPSLEMESVRTAPLTSEPSLEKEQQPLMRTVPPTPEPSLEKESVQNAQRAPGISLDLQQKLRQNVQRASGLSQDCKQKLRSATCECGRSRERPSPEGLMWKQPRWEVPKPTNLTETKALLKMGQDKC